MRRKLWAGASFIFALAACSGGGVLGLQADIKVEPGEIDFGVVYLGERAEAALGVANRGGSGTSLRFEQLPEGLKIRPDELQIGSYGQDFVKVEFLPVEEVELDTHILLTYGKKSLPVPLRVRALDAPYGYPDILDFGVVRMGGEESRILSLDNRLDEGLSLALRGGTLSTGARYEFPGDDLYIPARGSIEVPVVFRPSGEEGRQDGVIQIQCTGCPTREITLLGEGKEIQLSFHPDPILFEEVAPLSSAELDVEVENVGSVAAERLDFIVAGSDRFTLEPDSVVSLAPGEWSSILMRYEAPAEFGKQQAMLQVYADGRRKIAEVPLAANVMGTDLIIDGPMVELGAPVGWTEGSPYQWKVNVRNIGTRTGVELTTEIVGPDADAFRLVPLDDEIAEPGEPEPYHLFFEPQREGSHEAILHVRGDESHRALHLAAWGNLPIAECDDVDAVVQVARPFKLRGWDASRLADAACSWRVVEAPEGSHRLPQPANGCAADFQPDLVGAYTLVFEAKDAAGNADTCVRQFEAQPFQQLWIELFWDKPSDVDLYLLNHALGQPEVESHWYSTASCFYANCRSHHAPLDGWGPEAGNRPILDTDDLHGIGPENINIADIAENGLFSVGVHWFDRKTQLSTRATVNVYCDRRREGSVEVELDQNKLFYLLGTIDFSSGTCTVHLEPDRWEGFGSSPP